MKYKLVLQGFETQEELLAFANWFINSEKETFEFQDGSFPVAAEECRNKPIDIVGGTIVVPIEKEFQSEISKFKVILEGFETGEQALEFANWYEGSGEQYFDFLEGGSALTDMTKLHESGGFKVNENNEVVIPLRIIQ